jgi:hypothetical protein
MQRLNNAKIKMQKIKDTISSAGVLPQAYSSPGGDSEVIYFI